MAQVAALHSPEDVRVCVLTGTAGQDAWQWARWLPHCQPAGWQPAGWQNCAVLIGNDAETVAARIAELTAIVKARSQALREQGRVRFGSDIVVVFDGSRRLRSLPGAVATPDGTLIVQLMNEPAVGPVRPEYVTPGWAERVARSVAPIRDVSGDEEDTGLPGSCRLLDLIGLDPPDAGAIAAR